MEAVVKAVEQAIDADMPESFGLVLDGWSPGTEHYLAVYGCYETDAGPRYPLLSLAPGIEDADDQMNAEGHLRAFARFLPFFGKSMSGCKFLVGDSCAGNKRLANLIGVPLVGCASHRLNLAVRDYLAPFDSEMEEVQQLMRKLRTLKQATKLRTKTELLPVLWQDTRWSSTFAMLKRFFRLREFISADDEDLADCMPSRTAHRKLASLLDNLRDVESVSKRLQADELTLLDARDLCDGLIEIRPLFAKYLGNSEGAWWPSSNTVIGGRRWGPRAVQALFRQRAVAQPQPEATEGFAERILKRRKVRDAPVAYTLLGAIPPTSNTVERLFSVARAVLRHERHRLSPMMLEMILFLKTNSTFWNVATVEQCL
ncbi:unnamed protein product [Phytophthora fragariaefolia]|uniref:Unnamed protein product n=1 Tax=Phytophthora fragariaefolia TaxID=1490495 RepID=A0A9W6Y1C1_9STRA|nr:unnamed protein product [Phytophthora fragariaefolia]